MSNVVELFRCASFDPETVQVLCDAYDKARASMHDKGQPDIVKKLSPNAAAKRGQRDWGVFESRDVRSALAHVRYGLRQMEL